MERNLLGMSHVLQECIWAAAVMGAAGIVAALAQRILTSLAKRLDHTKADLADDLVRAIRFPVVMLIMLAGAYLALGRLSIFRASASVYSPILQVAGVMFVLLALTNAANLAALWYSRKLASDTYQSHLNLLRQLAILTVWVIGAVQIMAIVGIKVTAVLASLGIAGLAVGLALQDTIANLFAGFYMVADRSIRAGDYIKLENGSEGFVENVGWRNTRIKLWANNVVLIPNSKLTQSVITNMTLPDSALSVYTYCGVSYDSDLERVENVAVEVAKDVMGRFPGSDPAFQPVLRFKEFAESGVKFVVVFRAVDVGAQFILQHELIKALHRRFRDEGIEIPFQFRKPTLEGRVLSS